MKKILVAAFKSDELEHHLKNVIAVNDKCAVEDITDTTIIHEAKYVLSKFVDGSEGFEQHEEWCGEHGPVQQKRAKKT
ncbi:hypothetical protein [Polaromonas sp. CG_23.6]|uniref:hypothetical protein n=1 Tax=Polaromonas sp. CG_23.6 TaxID=2760709 RepID=UPI0024761070|nr:hypothetical protein [Polaromonas sp. CG_23.6]MDH6186827.1 hypothetical protein [Polaromonas sp. CG_23.6]